MSADSNNVVIGGGPAGLTAAYELSKLGRRSVVLEASDTVGGLSQTCEYKGYLFDIGGHRFFTKVGYVQELWEEILDEDFLSRPRQSRIFYRGQLFDYPLKPMNALRGLGPIEAVRVGLSYLRAAVAPYPEEKTFEHWVVNRFGRRLYEIFFKTYTEKVWGIPCSQISAEWASQRIKNLDLLAAVRNAFLGSGSHKGEVVTTLIDSFHYPRFGPGQMWTRCATLLEEQGSEVRLEAPVSTLVHDGRRVDKVLVGRNGSPREEVLGEQFFSSMPIRTLLHSFDPPPPDEVLEAADRLRYRDFLTVALIVDRAELFTDNWIYIHAPDVKVGRIQNYKNWSPSMVADPSKTALGLEYFVQEGDELWTASDEELVALGTAEVDRLGIAPAEAVEDGTVVRMPKAYPVYDDAYEEALEVIRAWLDGLVNLQLIGRNGQHRYNNQDHSMMTGVFAARNTTGADLDVWSVNVESEYHEEKTENEGSTGESAGDRLVPKKVDESDLAAMLRRAFRRYDEIALGTAVGAVLGVAMFLVTSIWLLAGDEGAPNPSLLGHYLIGYTLSWKGAFLALLEASGLGFLLGWVLARGINLLTERERRELMHRIERKRALTLLEGERP